ncbi:MAG: tetratricopeptide repeat protein [Nitrospirae bacterium]|nr:tetratricopeptide repeat protein [Nitrospirota bacterium]
MGAEEFYSKGISFLRKGNTLNALAQFQKAFEIEPQNPKYQSFFALCSAIERGTVNEAIVSCKKAIGREPETPELYFNLGKVYLKANKMGEAIEAFRQGLKLNANNKEISAILDTLGTRKRPILPFLSRDNFINKYLGFILSKLGFR